jgi:hypothetical protein
MMTLYADYARKASKESICNTHKAGIAAGYGDFFTIALVALLTWFSYFEVGVGCPEHMPPMQQCRVLYCTPLHAPNLPV